MKTVFRIFSALMMAVLLVSLLPAGTSQASGGVVTVTLPGGSLMTTNFNPWGGTNRQTYNTYFDFSAGPTTIEMNGIDLTDIWYEGKWPWPPLAESLGAQARFGISASGFWSLHSIHSAIDNGGGSWDQQGASWNHSNGFRKYPIQNQWSGTTPGVTVGNHQYNVEAFIPRAGAGASINDPAQVVDREYNTFDMKIVYTPTATPGQYQVKGWVRLHKAASTTEMATRPGSPVWGSPFSWVWNKAINNQSDPESAWVPFYDGSWVISGDYTSARPYVEIMNWGVAQTRYHTFSWDSMVVSGVLAPAVGVSIPAETICTGGTKTVTIDFAGIEDLYGYQFELNYSKDLVSAAASFDDTWLNTSTNASVPAGWDADCADGVCKFAVSKVDPGTAVSGSGTVATVTFTLNAPGTADLTISGDKLSDRDGGAIAHALSGGSFTICGWADVSGKVSLQGRATPKDKGTVSFATVDFVDYNPLVVDFDETSGAYSAHVKVMPGGSEYTLDAAHGLYLGNQKVVTLNAGDNLTDQDTKLKGGDANNDGEVELGDLTCIGGAFGGGPAVCGTTGSSDINKDGSTNIYDLSLAGGNYGLSTPQAW